MIRNPGQRPLAPPAPAARKAPSMPDTGAPSGSTSEPGAPIPAGSAGRSAPPRPLRPEPERCPPVPRSDSPVSRFLQNTIRYPAESFRAGLMPRHPDGVFVLPRPSAQAAEAFLRQMDAMDPDGSLRKAGEFAQSFRMEGGRVVANAPLRYEAGNSIARFADPPGTFVSIHSHPEPPPGMYNDFPSPQDHLVARDMRKTLGQSHELMYHPGSGRFLAFTGGHPPSFQEARLPPPPPGLPPPPTGSAPPGWI